jgi:Zn-dependent peptidase ImmA (M78 family)
MICGTVRLLGDRLMSPAGGLYPATRSFTYRQKAQRSFAAELLSPFDAVLNMFQGDFSLDKQLDVAAHFDVSELTVRTQLVNHKILEREDLEPDAIATVA